MLKHAKLMNPQHSNIPRIHHHHLNIILIQFHFMNSSPAASYILMATSSSTSVIFLTHATQKITTTWNCGERTQGLGGSKPGKGILYQQLLHKVLSTGTDCRPWLLSKVRLFLQYLGSHHKKPYTEQVSFKHSSIEHKCVKGWYSLNNLLFFTLSPTSLKMPASVFSQNGRLPHSKMYVMTPILHASDSGPDFLFNTSGAT